MILQLSDFAGMYRLPAGVATTDVQAAVEQVETALLRDLFEDDTANLILAAPAQPPATTLAAGTGGLEVPWRELALPWALQALRFGLVGQGIPTPRDSAEPVYDHTPRGRRRLFRLRLQRVREQYWQGQGVVTSTSATTLTLQIPALSIQWLRTGMSVEVNGEPVSVVSTTALDVDLNLPSFPVNVGDTLRFLIPLKLRKHASEWGTWTR